MTAEEFKQTFLPCSEQMFLLALRLTDSKTDAEDVVQDVFVKLWRGRGSLGSIENLQAYAITMTRNRAIDLIATRRNITTLDAIPEATEDEISEAMREAINNLPDTQRKIIDLRYHQELSMTEIERQTGLSQGNLRVILMRARNSIRKYFKRKKP